MKPTSPKITAKAIEDFIKKVRPEDDAVNTSGDNFAQTSVQSSTPNNQQQPSSTVSDGTDDGQMLYWDTNEWKPSDISDLMYDAATTTLITKNVVPQAAAAYNLGASGTPFNKAYFDGSVYITGVPDTASTFYLYNERNKTALQTLGLWSDGAISIYKNTVDDGGTYTASRMTCNVSYMLLSALNTGSELRANDCATKVSAIKTIGNVVAAGATEAFHEIDYVDDSGSFAKVRDVSLYGATRTKYCGVSTVSTGSPDTGQVTFANPLPDANYAALLQGGFKQIPSGTGITWNVYAIPCVIVASKSSSLFQYVVKYDFHNADTGAWVGSWDTWTRVAVPLQTSPVDFRVLSNTGLDKVGWKIERYF